MSTIDLHSHSVYSDGLHTPEEILEEAKKSGLKVIAISDHNWPHNMKEKVALAKKFGLDSIEALEVSTYYDKATLHILGYSKNFNDQVLIDGLANQNAGYRRRAEDFIKHVNSSGIVSLDMDEVEEKFKGFKHDFQVIITAAQKLNIPISESKIKLKEGYEQEKGDWVLSTKEAIELIHKAGGIAVWAHPKLTLDKKYEIDFQKVLSDVIAWGIDGLEVHHSEQTEEQEEELAKIAIENGLLMTGGSDFHGLAINTNRPIGRKGPSEEEYLKILEKLDEIKK